jgi:hypothetical protein
MLISRAQSPSLDSKLFRQPFDPANPLKAGQPVRFHPVLDVTWLSRPDLDEADIMIYTKGRESDSDSEGGEADKSQEEADRTDDTTRDAESDDGGMRHYKPLDLPVSAEYATSPPCARVILYCWRTVVECACAR